MTLGEKLYTLRTKQNMTQEQLAEKLQVSRQSISKWESDATRPDLGKLKFLAEFYHVSLDALLDENVDIFADKTISALNENTGTASDKNESVKERSATDSAFTNDNGNPATGNTGNHSSYSVSPETIDRITSEILDKNHKLQKRTTIGLGSACLALTVALLVVAVTFSGKLSTLSSQITQQPAPVYVNNDSDYTTEQDTYFQSYHTIADSVSEDGKKLHGQNRVILIVF